MLTLEEGQSLPEYLNKINLLCTSQIMLTRKNSNFFCPHWIGETKNISWVTKSHFTSLMKFKQFEQNI